MAAHVLCQYVHESSYRAWGERLAVHSCLVFAVQLRLAFQVWAAVPVARYIVWAAVPAVSVARFS
eukprot:3004914-Heterocapsa_arctica.AAC.1